MPPLKAGADDDGSDPTREVSVKRCWRAIPGFDETSLQKALCEDKGNNPLWE